MSPSRVPVRPLLAALAALCVGPVGCATPPPPPPPQPVHRASPEAEAARDRAAEAEARAAEARARAEEAQAERDTLVAMTEAEQAQRQRADQLAKVWREKFTGRSAAAQEAFRTRKFVPGMSRDEVKLLADYRRASGELLELKRIGERQEVNKKKETWIYCQPDCGNDDQVQGTVTFENGVLTVIQTGWVAP